MTNRGKLPNQITVLLTRSGFANGQGERCVQEERRRQEMITIRASEIYAISFAVAGWLAWLTQWRFARFKKACWITALVLAALSILVPSVLMRMRIWDRHPDMLQTIFIGQPYEETTHAHTFQEARFHPVE